MQDDFEKRVQQKMEELNLTPSAPVWEKIELQIRPEKKRRVFFWLFFAALLIGGSWWFLMQQQQTNQSSISTNQVQSHDRLVNSTPVNEQKTPANNTTPEKIASKSKNQLSIAKKSIVEGTENLFVTQAVRKGQNDVASKKIAGRETSPPDRDLSVAISGNQSNQEEKKQPETKAENQESSSTQFNADSSNNNKPATDEVKPSTDKKPAEDAKPSINADTSGRKLKVAVTGKGWQKRFLLQGGWSQYASGLTGLGASYQDRYATNVPNSSVSGGNSGSASSVEYTKGLSFATGLGLSRLVNERLALTIALQYAYYSVNSKVGTYRRIDTAVAYAGSLVAVGGYYDKNLSTDSLSTDFTTHYHVLELPVGIDYRLLKKYPLYVSLGAAYGRLMASNALTYNPSSGIYYENKENNSRNYLNLFAGLQYHIVQKGKLKLALGPQAQYNLTHLQKQYTGKAPHLFFAGIKGSIEF
jgi:hypothetical protein